MPKGTPLEKSLRVSKTVTCRGCGSGIKLKGGRRTAKKGHWCVECRNTPHIRSFRNVVAKGINITLEEFEGSYDVENCQCCGVDLTEGGGPGVSGATTRQIDHCHDTGEFRGVLCWSCNVGIGKLGDNKEGLIRALDYLLGGTS